MNEYRREWVDQVVGTLLEENRPRYSDVERLIDGATRDAADQAVAAGVYPVANTDIWKSTAFENYLHKAIEPIQSLYWTFDRSGNAHNGILWSHKHSLMGDVKNKSLPVFSQREIEQVAGDYVGGNFKTKTVDRLMVDLLVGMEFAQYASSAHVRKSRAHICNQSLVATDDLRISDGRGAEGPFSAVR